MTTNQNLDSPDELLARVVQAIRDLRTKQKLSAAALADLTDGAITRDTIANLESGRKRVIDVAELIVIAKALGVPPISLIYPIDPANASAALAFCGYDDEDSPMKPLFHLHDARMWFVDDDSAPARQGYRIALRAARKAGWVSE